MNSIKEAFQKINTGGSGVLQGKVIQASPLEIQMEGDDKYIVSQEVTKVPQHVEGLSEGERVYLLSTNMGKQFFVLGRV